MSNVVVYMSMSLDGFIAADGDGPGLGLGIGGESLHAWMTESFHPEDGPNAQVLSDLMSTGAVLTGRHTFEWAGQWQGDHHDGVPIFVLTRTPPTPAADGNVYYTEDLHAAVAQAKKAAGTRDVMMHGASSVQALHRLGLIDEFRISLVPVVLGSGKRLFAPEPDARRLRLISAVQGADVLHLRYSLASAESV